MPRSQFVKAASASSSPSLSSASVAQRCHRAPCGLRALRREPCVISNSSLKFGQQLDPYLFLRWVCWSCRSSRAVSRFRRRPLELSKAACHFGRDAGVSGQLVWLFAFSWWFCLGRGHEPARPPVAARPAPMNPSCPRPAACAEVALALVSASASSASQPPAHHRRSCSGRQAWRLGRDHRPSDVSWGAGVQKSMRPMSDRSHDAARFHLSFKTPLRKIYFPLRGPTLQPALQPAVKTVPETLSLCPSLSLSLSRAGGALTLPPFPAPSPFDTGGDHALEEAARCARPCSSRRSQASSRSSRTGLESETGGGAKGESAEDRDQGGPLPLGSAAEITSRRTVYCEAPQAQHGTWHGMSHTLFGAAAYCLSLRPR